MLFLGEGVWGMMTRREYYSTAPKNLGFLAFLRFEYQKRTAHSKPFKLTSRKLAFPVKARPKTSDLEVFSQILAFNEYRCVDGIKAPKLIVDLGANVGYSSAYFLSRFDGSRVIAVEPDPDSFSMLLANVARYSDRITTLNAAVWPRQERLSLNHIGQGAEWGASVSPSADGNVNVVTIPELLKLSGMDRISLLKIDIEGAEVELFSSGSESWLPLVDNIVIELHSEEARKAFFSKIDRSRFAISTCDELIVCLSN
jgi:FkbM family methyltransferase